jgi:adenylate cyclase
VPFVDEGPGLAPHWHPQVALVLGMADLTDVTRRLLAVFAADVEGYSRLMGADEVGTLKGLTERRAILDRLIGEHRGRIANTAGDSVLAEFGSAVDAVNCAVEAQAALSEASSSLPPDRRINFRIGIHIGDVLVRAGDLYGDGVNIAARLQTIAKPGGVCISGATYDQVRKSLALTFSDLGVQQVKNIEEPVRAFQVEPTSTQTFSSPAPGKSERLALPDRPSIAVLPFQNMSGDPEQEYFADGVVEDIITALSRFKSLFVIARNSSFSYKGKSPDVRQVGRDLGVKYVLEGSVRRAGSKLRITAQLIDAQSGGHVWADRFEGAPADVFEFQDEVTEKVVIAIAPRVERAEMARALRRSSVASTDAYDYYLRALALLPTTSAERADQALALLSRATELDPDFASAYGTAMMCHANRISYGPIKEQELARARNEVVRLWPIVARLGNDNGGALAAAAWAVAYLLRDIASAQELIGRAVELNPNHASAQATSGWISLWAGHPDRAIEQLSRAYRLDPASDVVPIPMAHACFFAERYEDALSHSQTLLRRLPNLHPALRIAAASAALAGHAELAHQFASRLLEIDPSFSVSRLSKYLGPYQRPEFSDKYAEGLRRAGLPEVSATAGRSD